ncbi:YtxH domain-containing protein [Isoptericola hypogeus]|uniref:YtxH domain-containing protein n=1 Tax=Isoptericola hypogeus TaxID=300179 RepID=UPI0031DB6C6E
MIGAALGYLLGTEKGRQQLDKAKDWATETWNDPRVQEKVSEVADLARDKAPGV